MTPPVVLGWPVRRVSPTPLTMLRCSSVSRFPGDGFREGPHTVADQVDGVDDVPLSRPGFFHHRSVRRATRDECSPGRDGLRDRQAVLAVGAGSDPAQDVRRGSHSPQQVVLRAFLGSHRPRVLTRGEHAPCRIPGVGGDGSGVMTVSPSITAERVTSTSWRAVS